MAHLFRSRRGQEKRKIVPPEDCSVLDQKVLPERKTELSIVSLWDSLCLDFSVGLLGKEKEKTNKALASCSALERTKQFLFAGFTSKDNH